MATPRPPTSQHTTALDTSAEDAVTRLGVHPALVVRIHDETRVLDLPAGAKVRIGRAEDNDLVIDAASISRSHLRLENRDGALWAIDCGSRNGVTFRRRKLRGEERLEPGDVLAAGPLQILVAGAAAGLAVDASANASTTGSTAASADAGPRDAGTGASKPRPDAAALEGVIVADAAMIELFRTVRRLASLDTTVLVTGETGVGKEVVARQLHALGARAGAPFVGINAAALPESLLEAELFGHERGAFTGADRRRAGVFQRAHRGTLFLDEVGEMPPAVQTKLLRVLETRLVQPLGAAEPVEVDVRIVTATHRDLRREVEAGRFREDLFFRISAFVLPVPPLRERPEEIALLAVELARRFTERHRLPRVEITARAHQALRTRAWPGNIRELKNAIEHALVLAEEGPLDAQHLPADTAPSAPPRSPGGATAQASAAPARNRPGTATATATAPAPAGGLRAQAAEAERVAIEAALREHGGNQSAAARTLGISRRALLYKMDRYGIRVRRELE